MPRPLSWMRRVTHPSATFNAAWTFVSSGVQQIHFQSRERLAQLIVDFTRDPDALLFAQRFQSSGERAKPLAGIAQHLLSLLPGFDIGARSVPPDDVSLLVAQRRGAN